ncbi:S9 family peptidase [Paenalkalicoccus suaedae]|uniref:S9 family peptidase n=1 Tax=Paenalkalicoccus suaedae TaxID=2592382 RepID=A0A859FCL4_9BACI|nr:S9 family peptidase [Paenalkalicoccus suaedae]QKS70807.1 S9 family peptidase [Paenalkalicoccus suaedae]
MMQKRAITAKDLESLHVIKDPHLHSGKVAYIRQTINTESEYESHLFVQDIDEPVATQWTFGDGRIEAPAFSPNGQWITFTGLKHDDKKPQLYIQSTHGGEPKKITSFTNGVSKPIWSPDSSTILFTTAIKKDGDQVDEQTSSKSQKKVITRLAYKSDAKGFLTDATNQLVTYDIGTNTTTVLTNESVDLTPSGFSPDAKKIVLFANFEGDAHILSDIYLFDMETKELEKITASNGSFTQASYSPDGRYLAILGHERAFKGATYQKLWTYEFATKELRNITKSSDEHLTDVMIGDIRGGMAYSEPVWHEDSIYTLCSKNGATELVRVGLDGEITRVTSENNHVYAFSLEGDTGVIGVSSPTRPGELYTLSLDSSKLKPLTAFNEDLLKDVHVEEPEEMIIKASDGLSIQGWLLKPYGFREGATYPGILEIHGGPHAMYGQTFFHEMQLFAAQGYAVFYSNPRGSHGYGQEFVNAVRGDYGGMDYDDLMTFTDAVLEENPWIDTTRLGVTGGSYGGFMTNWIVAKNNRFKVAATLRCISNWISFYGVSDIGYFFTEWEVGADFLADPDKLWEHSPLRYVNDIETPLLIMHGELDYRCPIEQAEQLYIALKMREKDVRFVRFPESNHELSRSGKPYLRQERLDELVTWFNDKL